MNCVVWKSSVANSTRSCYPSTALHIATILTLFGSHLDDRAFGREANVEHQFTLRGHKSLVSSVAFSPDGRTLASAGPHIKLWNPLTGDELVTLKTENTSQNFIRYSTDGQTLVSARGDGEVVLWDVANGKHSMLLRDPTGSTNAAVSPQGTTLAVIMNWQDWRIDVWNFSSKKRVRTIEGVGVDSSARDCSGAVQFSPDANILATAHGDGKIRLWAVMDGHLLRTINAHEPDYSVTSVAFSPDGKKLAASAVGNDRYYLRSTEITLWNVETGALTARFGENKYGVSQVAISPDGRMIASGGRDSTVRLWDISTQKPLATLKGHRQSVMAVAFSPDGRLIASGSGDRTVRVWKLPVRTAESLSIGNLSD